MKILEINKFFYPKGGADKHFLDVVRLLEEKGHQVAVFSMENPLNLPSLWKKYFVSYVGYGKEDSLWEKLRGITRMFHSSSAKKNISRLLDNFHPDIVHIHNIYHQISPSILGEIKKRKIPIIMTVHDYNLVSPNYDLFFKDTDWQSLGNFRSVKFLLQKGFKDSYLKSLLAILEYWYLRVSRIYEKNVDLFLSPSLFLKKILVEEGMDEKKIIVIPHFYKKDPLLQESERPEEGDRYILHFGRLSKKKGVQDLIEISKRFNDLELHLAGTMEDDLDIDSPKIKYLGFLDQNRLREEIRNSLFVVSASKLPETFGLVALESLENGKPFVSLDSGAYSEIVRNGQDGYICRDLDEFGEKIRFLSEKDITRKELSDNASQRSEDFSSEKYYDRFFSLLTSMTENDNL